jgi:hypothetical protein
VGALYVQAVQRGDSSVDDAQLAAVREACLQDVLQYQCRGRVISAILKPDEPVPTWESVRDVVRANYSTANCTTVILH